MYPRLSLLVGPAVLLSVVLSVPDTVRSASFDNKPKILLHVADVTAENACVPAGLSDCDAAQTQGDLGAGFVYLLVAPGDLPNLAGLECGVTYDSGLTNGRNNHGGIDVLSWTLCATLEFNTDGANSWPSPGSGNLITWDSGNACQSGALAVAGYFYVSAYSPDVMKVTPRPASGRTLVATCNAVEIPLEPADLGSVSFTAGATAAGCNPCLAPCAPTIPPSCDVSPRVLDFGPVTVGTTATRNLTVTNLSSGTLSGMVSDDGANFEIVGDPGYTLAGGASKTFQVAYHAVQTQFETATISTGSSCPPIPVLAQAVPAISCEVGPATIDFGYVPIGQSADREFTVRNTGADPFTITLQVCYTWWPSPQYSIVGPRVVTVDPGQEITSVVRYTPNEKAPAACQVSTGLNGCRMIDLLGTSVSPVGCSVNPATLVFDHFEVGITSINYFALSNIGGPPISGNLTFLQNPANQYSLSGNTSYNLAAGQTAYFTVLMHATQAGLSEGLIDFGCGITLPLQAYAQASGSVVTSVAPSTLDFGYVALGDSAYLPFVLTYTGGSRLVGRVEEACPDFYVLDPELDLGHNQSDTLLVIFKPSVRNLQRCTIYVPGGSAVQCAGNTVALPPLALQPDFLNFGAVAPGQTGTLQFSVGNPGSVPVEGYIEEQCAEFQVQETGGFSLSPGASKIFTVTFTPSSPGPRECDIRPLQNQVVRCVANIGVPVISTTWGSIKARY